MDHRVGISKDQYFVGSWTRASTAMTRPTPATAWKPTDEMYALDSDDRNYSWSIVQDAG